MPSSCLLLCASIPAWCAASTSDVDHSSGRKRRGHPWHAPCPQASCPTGGAHPTARTPREGSRRRYVSCVARRLVEHAATRLALLVGRVAPECPLSGAASPVPRAPLAARGCAACARSGPALPVPGPLSSTQTPRRDTGAAHRQKGDRQSGWGLPLGGPPTGWGRTPPDREKSADHDASGMD